MIVAEADPRAADWLRQCLGGRFQVGVAQSGRDALRALERHDARVVIVGRQLLDTDRKQLVAHLSGAPWAERVKILLAGTGRGDGSAAQPGVFYNIEPGLSAPDVEAIVQSALGLPGAARMAGPAAVGSHTQARVIKAVLDWSADMAGAEDLESLSRIGVQAISQITGASRAHLLFYDSSAGEMWTEGKRDAREGRASEGLLGFVARTKSPVVVSGVGRDPRYARALDDPRGDGSEHLLAVPVTGSDHEVHAVFAAVRTGAEQPFGPVDLERLASLAEQAGTVLHRLSLKMQADELLQEDKPKRIFRQEALAAAQELPGKDGEVLRISPPWIRWMYWVLMGLIAVGAVYSFVGTVDQYSVGRAIVRDGGRTEVVSTTAGAIVGVEVEPGARVEKGQLLARLDDTEEQTAFDAIERDFQAQVRNRLLDPTDEAASHAVLALRRDRDAALSALEKRHIRAPQAGVISDLRIRKGQHVVPGDVVMAVVGESDDLSIMAFLPGGDRPQLHPGMRIRLSLDNFRYAHQDLVIESVSESVMGPLEARRYLGPQHDGAVPIAGPVVVVRARLESAEFESDGETYQFHDGMTGSAEIKIRSERIIETLVPGVKGL